MLGTAPAARLSLLLALLAVGPAHAQVPGDEGTPPTEHAAPDDAGAPPTERGAPGAARPEAALGQAVQLYLDGRTTEARRAFQALLARGPDVPGQVRRDALAYMGDILLSEADSGSARSVFEALLDEDPAYPMDPFRHPPKVCAFFEDLRNERRKAIPPLPPPARPEPFPTLALAPFGAWYFTHRQAGAGVAIASVQAAAIATNVVFAVQWYGRGAVVAGSEEESTLRTAQVVANIAAAAGWVAWATPAAIEVGRWGGRRSARVGILPGGVSVVAAF